MPGKTWLPLLGCLLFIGLPDLHAQEITVFDVRNTLPLSNNEKVYRDYYINGGLDEGLRPGLVITVKRRKSLYDAYRNRSPGDLMVPVGRLKVIHAQKGLSVARLHSTFSRGDLPALDYEFIMIGDRLDMSTASMARKKKSAARKLTPKPVAKVREAVSGPVYGPQMSADFASQAPASGPENGPILQ